MADTLSKYHPVVSFIFIAGAILLGALIQHPAFVIAGALFSAAHHLMIFGVKSLKKLPLMILAPIAIALINPFFNRDGEHILFRIFGKPYTLEALTYGLCLAGILFTVLAWFDCSRVLLTNDKLIALLGNLIPSLSLLLVMVLGLIPRLINKTKQISHARRSIGKGHTDSKKERLKDGVTLVSALTSWALECSIVTADSMRARGYGSAKRNSFSIYTMSGQDYLVLCAMGISAAFTFIAIMLDQASAAFTPTMSFSPLSWGFAVYCIYLCIPLALYFKEAFLWHFYRSKA